MSTLEAAIRQVQEVVIVTDRVVLINSYNEATLLDSVIEPVHG